MKLINPGGIVLMVTVNTSPPVMLMKLMNSGGIVLMVTVNTSPPMMLTDLFDDTDRFI
jgi:2-polyprenyl-3-methyl-5-hydroxy-6-metoxy-1,4-benzoquinol methylase